MDPCHAVPGTSTFKFSRKTNLFHWTADCRGTHNLLASLVQRKSHSCMIYNTVNTHITSVSSSLWCHTHTAHAPQQSVARASCPKIHHRYILPPCTASFLSSRMTLHDKHGDRCTHHPAWLTNGFSSRTHRVKKILISNEWGSVTYFYHIYSILSSSSSQITVTGRIIIQVYLYITIV